MWQEFCFKEKKKKDKIERKNKKKENHLQAADFVLVSSFFS